ncbi:ABC transporter permease [Microbacterium elymi]|uniref:Oligopeptide transport system permease protein OppC n=1 Tax=Microbacterium elymi TaxID=2909587 RepID=A0ABY5NKC0_9MICO|nr:ABC transporter permease [Microbacterium elymi]UUT35531.1 ABC transporter permease [Microbacterium elymi]
MMPQLPETEPEPTKLASKPASRGRVIWRRLEHTPRFWIGATVLALFVLWALFGQFLTPWSPTDQDVNNMNYPPTILHWFGTDILGHDLYAQIVSGLQKSLIIGFIAGPAATIIAAVLGATAGYLGGWGDKVIAWLIDLMLVLPAFFILVLLYPFTHGSWVVMMIFLAVTGWMIMAQVIRNQTRSLREREFVKGARYMGFGTWSVVRRHIIPNVASLLIIDATLGIAAMILAETSLSFFGFGVQPPDVSLGTLLANGQSAATTRPWLFLFPAGTLIVLLLAISLVGDALRDAIDPTSGVNRA